MTIEGARGAVGELVRSYRRAAGLTQEALAERAGIAVRSVQAIESGTNVPSRDTLRLLSAALDLSETERLVLAEAARRVPRRGGAGSPWHGNARNLPAQLTSFVGRERELAEVRRLLDTTRLLTLTGPGGTGKTRLALQVAAAPLERFPQGVWLAELAPLIDPAGVPAAVAAAVGVHEEAGQPLLATLVAALRTRALLLVLDNCEHLLDAGAGLVEALLRGCPQVRMIATSREVLGIAGETVWRVPSLALPAAGTLPPPDVLAQVEAVRLFVERAKAVQPHFALTAQNAPVVVQICRRLDGIPLALELAAARLGGLSIDELAARLDHRFRLLTGGSRTALPRQQTLQAAVDWSYDLLSASERTLFNRLAVFSGGFTLEAAEAVCAGEPIAKIEVLDLLLRLVDRSLVIGEESDGNVDRYRLLETMRQYGRERLAAQGEAEALYALHFAHFRDAAERVALAQRDLQRMELDRLEAEHENLRQALGWALDLGAAQEGLRLAGALGNFWWRRGYFGEGRRWLGTLLLLPGAHERTLARARALKWQGTLGLGNGWLAGRLVQGAGQWRALHEEALAIAREVGDEVEEARNLVYLGIALGTADYPGARTYLQAGLALATSYGGIYLAHIALDFLGVVAWVHGDRAEARLRWEQSRRQSQHARDQDGYARALLLLAVPAFEAGELDSARTGLETALDVERALHDRMAVGVMLGALGMVAGAQGDGERARACFEEKRSVWEQVGERSGVAGALRELGWLARHEGATAQAHGYFAEALVLERELGDAAGIAASLAGLGDVARDAEEYAQAAVHYAEGLAQIEVGEAPNERAACLEGLVAVAWAGGNAAQAVRLCAAAAAARLPEVVITPIARAQCAEVVAAARAVLGEEAFAAAWAEGRAMPLEAVTYPVGEIGTGA